MFEKHYLIYKKHFFFSYVLFFIFLDERYWIFFFFNRFYKFILKLIKLKKKFILKNESEMLTFFNFIFWHRQIIHLDFIYQIEFYFKSKKFSSEYIYIYINQLCNLNKYLFFFILKNSFFYFLNRYTAIKKHIFFSNVQKKEDSILKNKISFYYVYKKSNSFFFNMYSFYNIKQYSYDLNIINFFRKVCLQNYFFLLSIKNNVFDAFNKCFKSVYKDKFKEALFFKKVLYILKNNASSTKLYNFFYKKILLFKYSILNLISFKTTRNNSINKFFLITQVNQYRKLSDKKNIFKIAHHHYRYNKFHEQKVKKLIDDVN